MTAAACDALGMPHKTVLQLADLHHLSSHDCMCGVSALDCRFPGTAEAYHAITECVDARLLMKAAVYTATHPEVGPQPSRCNISDGSPACAMGRHLRSNQCLCHAGSQQQLQHQQRSDACTVLSTSTCCLLAAHTTLYTTWLICCTMPPSAGDTFRWVRTLPSKNSTQVPCTCI